MGLDDYRTLGGSGLRVSPFALGTMVLGDAARGPGAAESLEILSRYVELGGNFLDCANGYAGGRSEEIIGDLVAARPELRDRLVIATKFGGNLHPGDPNGGGGGRKALQHQVEASLRRLRVEAIDLYWLHNHDRHTPVQETLSALDDLVRAGKVRYIGLSDTPAWNVARAATIAELRGWTPVTAIQVEYSLLERTVEGELLPMAEALGIGVTPFSPLAAGVLSGKYTREERAPAGSGRAAEVAGRLGDERTFAVLDALAEIAGELGTTVAAVALAWVQGRAAVSCTVIGARSVTQLEANLKGLDVTLPAATAKRLDTLTTPILDFPAAFLEEVARPWQQGGTTINGVPAG
jgi:aryl-alcohol dehydrogenase-like predicted oxidoreductase